MTMRTQCLTIYLTLLFKILLSSHTAFATNDVTLYTPYTRISVPPGESIDYPIDVINNGTEVKTVDISVTGIPRGWTYDLKSGGWAIAQIAVLPKEKKNFTLRIEVPLNANKGIYHVRISTNGFGSLPLTINVSQQGTFKTELIVKQPNMEGHSNSTFNFNAELKNRTAEPQLYALQASAPPGWIVIFRASAKQVTSVNVEPNKTENLTIEVDPPDEAEARSYKIPFTAITSATSASRELEVVITGTYKLELTTPTGLLSTDITAGDEKKVELLVKNTGSAQLKNVKLESSTPINWTVTFDPKEIHLLEPGKTSQVYATIKADKKAIAGDYVANLEAKIPETSSKVTFRISVRRPLLWGWIGILVIAGTFGGVYHLFRKYGRR